MEKNVVITGVSTGIGRATLDLLHSKGFNVFGSIRNQADGDKLSKIYPNRFTPLQFDVQNHDEVVKASKVNFDQCESLVGLINNAGIAVPGPLEHLSEKNLKSNLISPSNRFAELPTFSFRYLELRVIQINHLDVLSILALFQVYLILLLMVHIVFQTCLESMTDIYRRELKQFGIKVIAIEPGPIRTEIWKNLNKSMNLKTLVILKFFKMQTKLLRIQNKMPFLWRKYLN